MSKEEFVVQFVKMVDDGFEFDDFDDIAGLLKVTVTLQTYYLFHNKN